MKFFAGVGEESLKISCTNFISYIVCIFITSQNFPSLKKLNLSIEFNSLIDLQQTVSAILAYILGLTSLRLRLTFHDYYKVTSISCKVLMDIARFSQLEHLILYFIQINVTAVDSFFKLLTKGYPKLRSVMICKCFTKFPNTVESKR